VSESTPLRDRLAGLLYESVCETCSGYVENVKDDERTADELYYVTIDGAVDFGRLADAVIEKLGLAIERSADVGGADWGQHHRVVGKSTFHPGPHHFKRWSSTE
jgi:hypothetical protein